MTKPLVSNSLYLIRETITQKWPILNKTYPNRIKVQFPFASPRGLLVAQYCCINLSRMPLWRNPSSLQPATLHALKILDRTGFFNMYCKREGYTFNQRFMLCFSFTGHLSFTIFGFPIIGRRCKNLRNQHATTSAASAFEAVIGSVKST